MWHSGSARTFPWGEELRQLQMEGTSQWPAVRIRRSVPGACMQGRATCAMFVVCVVEAAGSPRFLFLVLAWKGESGQR